MGHRSLCPSPYEDLREVLFQISGNGSKGRLVFGLSTPVGTEWSRFPSSHRDSVHTTCHLRSIDLFRPCSFLRLSLRRSIRRSWQTMSKGVTLRHTSGNNSTDSVTIVQSLFSPPETETLDVPERTSCVDRSSSVSVSSRALMTLRVTRENTNYM